MSDDFDLSPFQQTERTVDRRGKSPRAAASGLRALRRLQKRGTVKSALLRAQAKPVTLRRFSWEDQDA